MTEVMDAVITAETEPEEEKTRMPLLKGGLIVAGTIGSGEIAKNMCDAFIPRTKNPVMNFCYAVGRYSISGVVTAKSIAYLSEVYDQMTDAIADSIVKFKEAKEEEA